MVGSSLAGMPLPVSDTAMTRSSPPLPAPCLPAVASAEEGPLLAVTVTLPLSVNLMALDNRLMTICWSRALSVFASPMSSATSRCSSTPSWIRGLTVSHAEVTSSPTSNRSGFTSIRPCLDLRQVEQVVDHRQ